MNLNIKKWKYYFLRQKNNTLIHKQSFKCKDLIISFNKEGDSPKSEEEKEEKEKERIRIHLIYKQREWVQYLYILLIY